MKKIIPWLIPLLYMGLIYYISGLSRPIQAEMPHGFDKVLHFGAYGLLGLLLGNALKGETGGRMVIIGWAIATLYGVTDELHQALVPGRDASVYDLMADSAGGLAGLIVYAWLLRGIQERHITPFKRGL